MRRSERRSLAGEGGFTLPEMLVAVTIMAAVLFALYAVFDAGVRVFGAGRDRAEAVQAARLGLARMEREIRAAYPRGKAEGDATLLTDFGEDRLAFGNDLNGNRRTADPATGLAEPGEGISYTLDAAGAPCETAGCWSNPQETWTATAGRSPSSTSTPTEPRRGAKRTSSWCA